MASEKQQKEMQAQQMELQERPKVDNPSALLEEGLGGLRKFGGFQLVKGLIKDIDRMDPKRRAVKNSFLAESAYANTRKRLRDELELWIQILEGSSTDPMEIADGCRQKSEKAMENLGKNLAIIHEELSRLEVTYRSLDSFFANAGQGKIDCITLMNVQREDLIDNDSDDTVMLRDELERYYDRLSLKNNYSLLVLPGYLGDAVAVREWAKTAYRNKVIMISDFKDCQDFSELRTFLENDNLQGQDAYLGNAVMTCNYLLGRRKSELADEYEDLYIPGSAALAGRMSNTEEVVIAQGAAGKKYGTLDNVRGARMDLRKSEIAALIDLGVVPMVEEDGRTMAFSNRSLYNGATQGLQEYPIVRVFDWIGKVFQNFFNDEAFTNWNPQVKGELERALHDFLSDYKGPGKLIESYSKLSVEQDPKTKDIKVHVEMKPIFAARNFYIELSGHKETAGVDWEQTIQ